MIEFPGSIFTGGNILFKFFCFRVDLLKPLLINCQFRLVCKKPEWPEMILAKLTTFPCIYWIENITRKHSSRLRTVRCSGSRGWGVSGQGGLPRGCLPRRGVCPWGSARGVCIPACTEADTPVDRILDTHSWKYYLAATLLRTVNIPKKFSKLGLFSH